MKRRFPVFLMLVASAFAILALAGHGISRRAHADARSVNTYTLKVEGTAGVQLDMLLITKPTMDAGPTRASARIKVPFSKVFAADRCFVWLDTLPNGASGKKGDKCRIMLETKGRIISKAETTLEPDHGGESSGLGDL